MKLPQKVYEALRWIVSIVLPAVQVLLVSLTSAWGWNIPIDAITATLAAIALFLGAVFGISKLTHDNSKNKTSKTANK